MAVRRLSPIVETNTPSFYPAQRIEKKRRICQKPACVRVSSSGMILRFRIVFALTQDFELHPSTFNLQPAPYCLHAHTQVFWFFSHFFLFFTEAGGNAALLPDARTRKKRPFGLARKKMPSSSRPRRDTFAPGSRKGFGVPGQCVFIGTGRSFARPSGVGGAGSE